MEKRNIIISISMAALFALSGIALNAQTDKYEFKRTNAAGTAWTAPQAATVNNALLATDAAGAPVFTPQGNFLSASALPNAATLAKITESGGLPLWSGSEWPGGGGDGGAQPWTVDGLNIYANVAGGFVGIGTASPLATLDVLGTVNSQGTKAGFRFFDRTSMGSQYWILFASSGVLHLQNTSAGSDAFSVDYNSGNVTFYGGLSVASFVTANTNSVPRLADIVSTSPNILTATGSTQGVIFYSSGTAAPPSGSAPKGAIYIQYQ